MPLTVVNPNDYAFLSSFTFLSLFTFISGIAFLATRLYAIGASLLVSNLLTLVVMVVYHNVKFVEFQSTASNSNNEQVKELHL